MTTDKILVAFSFPARFESDNSQNISIFPNFPPGFFSRRFLDYCLSLQELSKQPVSWQELQCGDTNEERFQVQSQIRGGRE